MSAGDWLAALWSLINLIGSLAVMATILGLWAGLLEIRRTDKWRRGQR